MSRCRNFIYCLYNVFDPLVEHKRVPFLYPLLPVLYSLHFPFSLMVKVDYLPHPFPPRLEAPCLA